MKVFSLLLSTCALCISLKIQRIKLENEAKTIMKPAKTLQVYSCFFIYNLISIQWLIFTHDSPFNTSCFHFHDYSSLFLHSGLCQLLIWQVPALFNCPNICNSVKHSCKCLQLIASYLWVMFLVSRNPSYLISGFVNSYYTISQLLFTWEDLKHHLRI